MVVPLKRDLLFHIAGGLENGHLEWTRQAGFLSLSGAWGTWSHCLGSLKPNSFSDLEGRKEIPLFITDVSRRAPKPVPSCKTPLCQDSELQSLSLGLCNGDWSWRIAILEISPGQAIAELINWSDDLANSPWPYTSMKRRCREVCGKHTRVSLFSLLKCWRAC